MKSKTYLKIKYKDGSSALLVDPLSIFMSSSVGNGEKFINAANTLSQKKVQMSVIDYIEVSFDLVHMLYEEFEEAEFKVRCPQLQEAISENAPDENLVKEIL